jgi:hypothetical protein
MIIGVYHSIVIELAFPRNTGTQGERNSKETFFPFPKIGGYCRNPLPPPFLNYCNT